MNVGLQVGMIDFAKKGSVLHRKHQNAAPPSGAGVPMTTLAFSRLRELAEEGAGSGLTERQMFWKQAPGKAGSKRKGAPNAGGQRFAHTQGRTSAGGEASPRSRIACWSGGLRSMAQHYGLAGKLHVSPPPSRRQSSVGRRVAAEAPTTAAAATAALSGGHCSR